jgi:hypothetical protein
MPRQDTGRSQGHLSSCLLGGAPGERHRAMCKTDRQWCDTPGGVLNKRQTQIPRRTGQTSHRTTLCNSVVTSRPTDQVLESGKAMTGFLILGRYAQRYLAGVHRLTKWVYLWDTQRTVRCTRNVIFQGTEEDITSVRTDDAHSMGQQHP